MKRSLFFLLIVLLANFSVNAKNRMYLTELIVNNIDHYPLNQSPVQLPEYIYPGDVLNVIGYIVDSEGNFVNDETFVISDAFKCQTTSVTTGILGEFNYKTQVSTNTNSAGSIMIKYYDYTYLLGFKIDIGQNYYLSSSFINNNLQSINDISETHFDEITPFSEAGEVWYQNNPVNTTFSYLLGEDDVNENNAWFILQQTYIDQTIPMGDPIYLRAQEVAEELANQIDPEINHIGPGRIALYIGAGAVCIGSAGIGCSMLISMAAMDLALIVTKSIAIQAGASQQTLDDINTAGFIAGLLSGENLMSMSLETGAYLLDEQFIEWQMKQDVKVIDDAYQGNWGNFKNIQMMQEGNLHTFNFEHLNDNGEWIKYSYETKIEKDSQPNYTYDYSVEIIPPANTSLMVGDEVTISAKVSNKGTSNETQNATLILYDNGTEIDRTTTFSSLTAGGESTYIFSSWTATEGGHQFKVEVLLPGDENTENDQDTYAIFVGSPGMLLVEGQTNPVKNLTLSPGNSKKFSVLLRNTGSEYLDVNIIPDANGNSHLFVGTNGDYQESLSPNGTINSTKEFEIEVGCYNSGSPGDSYTGTVTFNYQGKNNVLTLNIDIVEYTPGYYEDDLLSGSISIDGGGSSTRSSYNLTSYETLYIDGDPASSYPEVLTFHTVDLDQDDINHLVKATWGFESLESVGGSSATPVRFGIGTLISKSYTWHTYDENYEFTRSLKAQINKINLWLNPRYENEKWKLVKPQISYKFCESAWGGQCQISYSDLNKWDDGDGDPEILFSVDHVYNNGTLHLFNNRVLIKSVDINSTGNYKFDISRNDLYENNYFVIQGDYGDGTKVNISEIKFKVDYFTGDPDLNCRKSLSKNIVNINENVTVNLQFENVGSNVAENAAYDESALPDGLTYVSGNISDNIFTDVDPETIEETSYTIKATKAGTFTIPATNVVYEDPSGHTYETTFNALTLTVSGGNILVSAETANSSYEKGDIVRIFADVTEDVNNSVLQDAKVNCNIKNLTTNTTCEPLILVYDNTEGKFLGQFEETSLAGNYEISISAQRDGYTDGALSTPIYFEVIEEKYLDVTPGSRSVTYNSTSTSFTVSSNVNWNISEEVAWLTASKSGDDINVSLQQNSSQSIRSGLITVVSDDFPDKVVSIVQDGAPVPLAAGLFADIQKGEAPLTVSFYDQSTGNPTSWSWDFGDGNTSAEKNPEHTYTTAGTYTVKLLVTTTGDRDSVTIIDYIVVDQTTSTEPVVKISEEEVSDALCFGDIGTFIINYNVFSQGNNIIEHGICITPEGGSETCYNNGSGTGDFQYTGDLGVDTYNIRVYAKDENGATSYSDASVITISGPATPLQIVDYYLEESTSSFTLFNLQVNGGTPPYMVQVTGSPDASSFGKWVALDGSALYYNGLNAGTTYTIQLMVMDANNCSTVKEFQIKTDDVGTSPEVAITAPSGGELWPVGSTQKITWTDNFDDDMVLLLYKGVLVKSFVDSISGFINSNGTHYWKIPEYTSPGDDYYVKAVRLSDETVSDYSNRFEIVEAVDPEVEVQLYRISDTSGELNTSNPGEIKTSFYRGETARITLAVTSIGGSVWPLGVLNVFDESGGVIYDSHELGTDNSLPNFIDAGTGVAYMSFDWTIPEDAEIGTVDIGAAVRDQNNWETLYDETTPGPNTTDFGANWIINNQISIIAKSPVAIEIKGNGSIINENSSAYFKCFVNYSDGSTEEITELVNWSVNSSNAFISSAGLFTSNEVTTSEVIVLTASYMEWTTTYNVTVRNVEQEVPTLTIKEIQSEQEASEFVNQQVYTKGIITAVTAEGYFIQDANMEWSGIFIAGNLNDNYQIGDGLAVVGRVNENQGFTEIADVSEHYEYEPEFNIDPVLIEATSSLSEEYEGVLVTCHGFKAAELKSSYANFGEWEMVGETNNTIIVDDLMYKHEPVVGDFYKVTGVVNFASGSYKLEPRFYQDVVNLTLVSVLEINKGIFKINLYPNPTPGNVTLDLLSVTASNVTVSVMTATGLEIFRKSYKHTDNIRFDLSNHVNGLYFVKITADEFEVVKKLMLEH